MASDTGQGARFQEQHQYKKRRLRGACDVCFQRKIKCNRSEMPNNKCSNCIAYGLECTHNRPHQPRTMKKRTQKKKGNIQALEKRVEEMEQLLHQVRPDVELEDPSFTIDSSGDVEDVSRSATPPSMWSQPGTNSGPFRCTPVPVSDLPYPIPRTLSDSAQYQALSDAEGGSPDEEDLVHIALTEHISNLSLNPMGTTFFGDSSAFIFLQRVYSLKREVTAHELPFALSRDVCSLEIENVGFDNPRFDFPGKGLLDELSSLYFDQVNICIPLLHRPSFERDLNGGLHLRDVAFAQVVLMVCAIACRCTDDPRVLLSDDTTPLFGGFKYFQQTLLLRRQLLVKPGLYDLQYYCLLNIFLTMSSPQAGWSLVGLALRFAQELGLHRYRGDSAKPTVAGELWKRCFWVLIMLDRLTSSFTGRLCAINDEDLDADIPLDCDDQYWECTDAEQSWKQPLGTPSKISAFNAYLRLCEILTFALRTLYSTKKSKLLTGLIGDQWEQRVVADLDSAMNKWKDSLPDHLRWNPHQENTTFLHQSAWLHTTFYYIQIQIHRPYIQKPSPLSFPSLAICAHAARACSHIVDAKGPGWLYPFPSIVFSTFASGIVMLLTIYEERKAKLNIDPRKAMESAQRCINALKSMESKCQMAGRFADVLTDLAKMEDRHKEFLTTPLTSNKRRRDFEEPTQEEQFFKVPTEVSTPTSRPHPVLKSTPSPSHEPASVKRGDQGTNDTRISPPALSQVVTHGINPPPLIFDDGKGPLLRSSVSGPSMETSQRWDLSQLLLAETNFSTVSQTQDAQMQRGTATVVAPSFNIKQQQHQQELVNVPAFPALDTAETDPEAAALWSDIPSNFNLEDWDKFMANMNRMGS